MSWIMRHWLSVRSVGYSCALTTATYTIGPTVSLYFSNSFLATLCLTLVIMFGEIKLLGSPPDNLIGLVAATALAYVAVLFVMRWMFDRLG